MDPIHRLSRLMETLRQQMAESAKRLGASRQNVGTSTNRPAVAGNNRRTIEELRQQIGRRIRAIEPNNPESERQARRAFLESVLAWEFGDQLLLDNQFNRLIDGIQDTLESDPDVDRELKNVLTEISRR